MNAMKRKAFVIGVAMGVLLTIVFVIMCSWIEDPKASKFGMTILMENDRAISVPKGYYIYGNAQEVETFDGSHTVIKNVDTPCVTTREMTIKCSGSICIIYPPDKFGTINYDKKDLAEKLLK